MSNSDLVRLLTDLANLLEMNGDNPFRVRAFRRAADVAQNHSDDLANLSRDSLLEIPGIGKGIADIIGEFHATGSARERESLRKRFPDGVLALLNVGGLGPKRAAELYRSLRIDSVEKLAAATEKGRLRKLPGFGEKLETVLRQNLTFANDNATRRLVTEARALAEPLLDHMRGLSAIQAVELAGSARRWRETVGDIDILAACKTPALAIEHFQAYRGFQRVLAAGPTKVSVVLPNGLQCDFRVVDPASYGAALLYFTGSKQHNVRLREIAQRKGLTLNEYGLFKGTDEKKARPIAAETEKAVYERLGLAWIPPELREDRGEIEAAGKGKLPTLVEETDVRGDMHNHTKLSDGYNSLEEMVAAAQKQGWEFFFSGDHSPSLTVASGLPVPVLKKKMAAVKALDRKKPGLRVFTSSEVDILADGRMDYPDPVLDELGCVVASVHSRFQQSKEEMTDRLLRAIRHPSVDVIGHISGRLIGKRPGYEFDYDEVLNAAKKADTAIEINGQPDRQELDDAHVRRAVGLGIKLVLSTDAHSVKELSHMRLAVHIARRGWAEKKDIVNCWTTERALSWFGVS